jgi:DNA-nicking Smr family endonuclease
VDRDDDDSPFGGPVEIPIEDSIDLHYFRPSEQADVVDAYVEAAAEAGFREVRIVHGRGRGVQRSRIQRRLARSPHVERFADAPADRGGWGATLVWLRRDEATAAAGDGDPVPAGDGDAGARDPSGRR